MPYMYGVCVYDHLCHTYRVGLALRALERRRTAHRLGADEALIRAIILGDRLLLDALHF